MVLWGDLLVFLLTFSSSAHSSDKMRTCTLCLLAVADCLSDLAIASRWADVLWPSPDFGAALAWSGLHLGITEQLNEEVYLERILFGEELSCSVNSVCGA